MKKKGFTLIELLAVIIILAVIALIATPVVLNVVEEAKEKANKNSAYGFLDAAKYYYAESLLNSDMLSKVNGTTNIIEELNISGDKPDSGMVYIKDTGETAIAVVYGNKCYKKEFEDTQLDESEDIKNCNVKKYVKYKCIRATELHSATCGWSGTYYCGGSGYTLTGTKGTTGILYGNYGIDGELNSGDAFDCDVNGDGVYDSETERFYYVSDVYDTKKGEFNNEYAALIYYNNTISGEPKISTVAYSSDNINYNGPVTAIANLPTSEQWKNVSLYDTTRVITNETGDLTTKNGTLPETFSYEGYAARLLTYQELANTSCAIGENITSVGVLSECNYIFESTMYYNHASSKGHWLENPNSSLSSGVWAIDSAYLSASNKNGTSNTSTYYNYAKTTGYYGVRPVIEVSKSDIQLEVPEIIKPKCIRATELHKKSCYQWSSYSYCRGDGYEDTGSKGTSYITYGNENVTPGVLKSGDAFDCDLNGDGRYNSNSERFYYMTDFVGNDDKEYAVLVYYADTEKGTASETPIAYDTNSTNYNGPVTALAYLPTSKQWPNVSLSNSIRQLKNETGNVTTGDGANNLSTFSYDGYAARLLTYDEVVEACGNDKEPTATGYLNNCGFLMEYTKYEDIVYDVYGTWLETPYSLDTSNVWSIYASHKLAKVSSSSAKSVGVRPAIEVLKSDIKY